MMKTVYHMRSCIENTVQLRNAVFNSQKLYRIIWALISYMSIKLLALFQAICKLYCHHLYVLE